MRARDGLGLIRPTVVVALLVLAGQTGPAAAAPHHQDFARAAEDYAALVAMGVRVRDISDSSLVFILRDDPSAAVGATSTNPPLVDAMAQVVSYRGPVPSATVLEPLWAAARDLASNATRLSHDFVIFERISSGPMTSYARVMDAIRVLDQLLDTLDDLDRNAEVYEARGIDAAVLRVHIDALRGKFKDERSALEAAAAALADAEVPPLFAIVTATPATLALGETLEVSGALFAGVLPAADSTVTISFEDGSRVNVTTDGRGTFRFRYTIPINASQLGARAVIAEATQGSDQAHAVTWFNVTRIPTRTSLAAERLTTFQGGNVTLVARVDPVPPPARIDVVIDNTAARAIMTNATRRAELRLEAAGFTAGCHSAIASFAGDAIYAPSKSPALACAFSVSEESGTGRPASGSSSTPIVDLLVPSGLFDRFLPRWLDPRGWSERLGPAGFALLLLLLIALIIVAAALAARLWVKRVRAARARRAALTSVAPVDYSGLPAEIVTAIERGVARIDPGPQDPLHTIVRAYAGLLVRLAREGVDPRPLTPRELARVMLARRYPAESVETATSLFELALYADRPLDAESVSTFEGAVTRLSGAST